MSLHSRQILTTGSSRKRKERETSYSVKPPPPTVVTTTTTSSKAAELDSSNLLLAGCMAYEFLTKGTLLGKKCHDSADHAEPGRPVSMISSAESANGGQSNRKLKLPQQSYDDVARLLNSDGAHIQGIVNPTQLARWIQM